jgi:hypothetical protein
VSGITYNTSAAAADGTQEASQNLTIPAGVLAGDVMLLAVAAFYTAAFTPAIASTGTAFTQIGASQAGGNADGFVLNGSIWYAIASASDAGKVITASGNSAFWGLSLVAYTGASNSAPVDVDGGTLVTSSSTTSIVCPSETTGVSGDWAVYLCPYGIQAPTGFSGPAGTTQRTNTEGSGVGTSVYDSNGSVGGPGTGIGGGSFSGSGAAYWWTAFTVGLAPPVTAAAPPAGPARPGQAWKRRFQPWRRAVQGQQLPGPVVTVSGSMAMAPMAISGSGVVSSVAASPALPGPAWRRAFQPWRRAAGLRVQPPPAVTVSGSMAMSPMAISGSAAASSVVTPPATPGPAWRRAFQPWRRGVGAQALPPPVVTVSGSLALAPMAASGSSVVSSVVSSPAAPGPAWRRRFQPWRRAAGIRVQPPQVITVSGSLALAPMGMAGTVPAQGAAPAAAAPGQAWKRVFQPWRKAVQAQQQPAPVVTVSGSLALSPMALSGSGVVAYVASPPATPGQAWRRVFQPWRRGVQAQALPPPTVTVSGSLALAPMAISGNAAASSSFAPPAAAPARTWTRRFQPWRRGVGAQQQPPGTVTISGSLSLSPMGISGSAALASVVTLPAAPGRTWLRRFQPWRRGVQGQQLPPPVITVSGSLALAPMALQGAGSSISLVLAPGAALPGPSWRRHYQPWRRAAQTRQQPQNPPPSENDRAAFLIFFP